MVGRGVTGRRWRHIAQDDVGEAAEGQRDHVARRRIANVRAQQGGPEHRRGLGEVDTDDDAAVGTVFATSDYPLDRYLGPAARRTAEIEDTLAGPQQPISLVEP